MLADLILQTALERSWITSETLGAARERLNTDDGVAALNADEAALARLYADGSLRRGEVLAALGEEFAMPTITAEALRPEPEALAMITREQAAAWQVLPLHLSAESLSVAIANPLEVDVLDALAHLASRAIEPVLADAEALAEARDRAYGKRSDEAVQAPREVDAVSPGEAAEIAIELPAGSVSAEDGPIVRYVHKLISEALRLRASDIHLEPMERRFRVRFRIDGRLREVENPPQRLQSSIVSRLKLMAQISIAEKRVPQDGRIQFHAQGKSIDLRVSSLPSVFGETLVLRILDKEGLLLGLPELGFCRDDQDIFERVIAHPDGIFLVTGPTGSGKSTTLYAALNYLNRPDRKLITVEDPVEYQLSGINQVQVRREIGMDFAAALRAMLRQAPNIIMVGEIRDRETAEIAIHASLTGHMVFSTLHTNDAPSAISRLVDLGVKPFLVSASLRAVMAQRLVRSICPRCRTSYAPDPVELAALGLPPAGAGGASYFHGGGCVHCGGIGYRGRKGLFEILEIGRELEELIYHQASLVALRRRARELGLRTMREDGRRKVQAGLTTVGEVLAVTIADPISC